MGAPAVASALANTRTGRKATTALVILIVLANAAVFAPLVAVPTAVAGQASAAQEEARDDAVPAVKGDWGYPLAGSYSTGRGYGYHPVKGCAYCPSNHLGYDMDQPCGAKIHAAGPGTVITAGPMPGWGNTVRVDHGDGVVTLYGHMQWHSQVVVVGDRVTAGSPLGSEGSTGKSTGCHLHFEVQLNGIAVDPEPFMAARGLPLR